MLSESETKQAFDTLLEQDFAASQFARKFAWKAACRVLHSGNLGGSILLHTSHSGIERERYMRGMKRRGVRTLVLVHDVIPLTHPEYCRPGIDETHERRMHVALKHSAGIIANSRNTLDSLAREAERSGLRMPPAVIAHLAPGVTLKQSKPRPIDAPYFVMLGTIEPRKNHWFMLHVWRRLVEMRGKAAPKLVIVGRRGWECENAIDMLERCSPIRDHVIELADCSDEKLHDWLQHARALLFPSFVEGYGMPLVEALTLRVPVIASDLDVFHEITGEIPDYLDPLDGPGWINRILSYVDEASTERSDQLKRIQNFRQPTWAEHFDRVDSFLESLASS